MCCMLHVVCKHVVCYMLDGTCCMLRVVFCILYVGCVYVFLPRDAQVVCGLRFAVCVMWYMTILESTRYGIASFHMSSFLPLT